MVLNEINAFMELANRVAELRKLAKRGVIKQVVSKRFKPNQAGDALQMLKDGKIVGRGVINP